MQRVTRKQPNKPKGILNISTNWSLLKKNLKYKGKKENKKNELHRKTTKRGDFMIP